MFCSAVPGVQPERIGCMKASRGAMERNWTAESCLARACRLMIMADEATSYDLILTYEELATEWITMAARCPREATSPTDARCAPGATPAVRRRRSRFRRS